MICPTCSCQMSHNNDFSYDDLGYIGEGTVSFYECLSCGTMVEVNVPEETINRREHEMKELFQNFEERDCKNCKHKMPNGDCNSWACDFVPKDNIVKEVQEWLAKTNNADAEDFAR